MASIILGFHSGVPTGAAAEWEAFGEGRQRALALNGRPAVGFTLLAARDTGLQFTNFLAQDRHLTNQILLNGSGVAAGDVDGDGWCDLYFCGLDGANALFRNLGGWRFEDATARAGVGCAGLDATGAALADLDGDGDLDLVVNTVGAGTRIFANDGQGRFSESPAPLNSRRCGTSLALADIDGDGDLDLYVANYRAITIRDQPDTRFSIRTVDAKPQVISVDGVPVTHPDLADRFNFRIDEQGGRGTFAYDENGEADVLLRNEGGGRFAPVSFTEGAFLDEQGRPLAKPPFDWGLSVMFRDLNGDGAPDLYVCNDFKSPDRIWINDGRGRFQAMAPLPVRQLSLSSMGVDFADINRDGFDEFLVVDMLSREHSRRFGQRIDIRPEMLPVGAIDNRPQVPRNTLFVNRGDGTWAECAQFSGLEATEWAWTPIFLDVDLDGYEDLLVSNGFERDGMNADVLRRMDAIKKEQTLSSLEKLRLRTMFPRLDTANLAFRNLRGMKFKNVSDEWSFNLRGVSQGMCLADLDNDGDQDVILNNLNGLASLYRNESGAPRIAVRLKGLAPNTRGIGAKIKVSGGPGPQSQEMISGGRYLSSDDAMRTFAAAGGGDIRIEVTWRSGKRTIVIGAKANRIYEIDETSASNAPISRPRAPTPHFMDVSAQVGHSHADEPFDDFASQPTLSRRLSQLGPGVSWFDVDGDGWEDLSVGSGRGGRLAVFRNDGRGGFVPSKASSLATIASRDQTSILGWRRPDGQTVLLAGSANYEDGLTNGGVVRQYDLQGNAVVDLGPGSDSSSGPLSMADVDGDGDLDMFVGGRVRPGRYPEAASSRLFRNVAGRLELDATASVPFASLGLVSGSVFSDLDGDGDPDLVLACEWGPLKIFRNERGKFVAWDWSVKTLNPLLSTLNQLTGWWNGVTTGDFDGDGRLDIAASNWGQNTRYESYREQPLLAFYGEAASDGVTHFIEGYSEKGSGRVLPLQPFHITGVAMPAMRERVGTFEKYARSTLPEIYGELWNKLKELRVTCLESTVFLNRGSGFEAVSLPLEAQMAPAFAVCTGDLDGDGHEDLFLSQNFFAVHAEYSRHDAGRGLWLRGDGRGGFTAVPGQESGLHIYGEQRGAALCDYDGDGRLDLAVSQNAAQTKLYRNAGAKPGLRVRLIGSSGNPSAVGAIMRLVAGQKMGPAREVHAGSGYWSQDGAVPVISLPETPTHLWVRWPGGREQTVAVPADAKEIVVDYAGKAGGLDQKKQLPGN